MRAPLRFRIAMIGAVVVVVATIGLVCRHRRGGGDLDAGRTGSGMSGVSGEIEQSVVSGVRAQLGVDVSTVRCAAGRCAAVLVSGGELPLDVHGRDWRLDGLVIASGPLEAYVRDALGDLGVATTVDCGPRVRAAHVADRIACALGTGGRAFATIRDATGAFTIELALDPATAAVRDHEVDVAALDRMSAALDRGGAASADGGGPAEGAGDDDGVATDAGSGAGGVAAVGNGSGNGNGNGNGSGSNGIGNRSGNGDGNGNGNGNGNGSGDGNGRAGSGGGSGGAGSGTGSTRTARTRPRRAGGR